MLSFQEDTWSRPKKYESKQLADENETNVVAVFVEVDAVCPNQVRTVILL